MKGNTVRASLAFGKATDDLLASLAAVVSKELYGNTHFPNPPVEKERLLAAMKNFSDARIRQTDGGRAATAWKHQARAVLIGLLKLLARYAEEASDNGLAVFLSSGFSVRRHNTARSALETPTIIKIKTGQTGEALSTVTKVSNARCYEIHVADVEESGTLGPWIHKGSRSGSRNLPAAGLKPGGMHAFKIRAIGGSQGYSDWCDTVRARTL